MFVIFKEFDNLSSIVFYRLFEVPAIMFELNVSI